MYGRCFAVRDGAQMAAISNAASINFNLVGNRVSLPSRTTIRFLHLKPLCCTPVQQLQQLEVEAGILCEPCSGKGWLLCDFCKGQKTNVKAENKRIYRRCPSCRATGYILCSKCKVFKCVTFPNSDDGKELAF